MGRYSALAGTRRSTAPAESLPMLLGDGEALEVAEGAPLPLLPAFTDAAHQDRFIALWMLRWNEVVRQLDAEVKSLDEDEAYAPEAMDMRGAAPARPGRSAPDRKARRFRRSARSGRWASCLPWRTGPTNGPRRATRRPRSGSTTRWSASSR